MPMPGGRVAPTEVVGIDPAYDLALLRVPGIGARVGDLGKPANPRTGSMLAAAGSRGCPWPSAS